MWRNFGLNALNFLFTKDNVCVNLCLFAICAIFLQNLFFAIYAILSKNCFVAINSLSMWSELSPKFCPWRKNDKYDVWNDLFNPSYICTFVTCLSSNLFFYKLSLLLIV